MNSPSHAKGTALLSDSLLRQLNLYALGAAAAGVAVMALVPASEAKIVYTPAHMDISLGASVLDVNHDGTVDFTFNRGTNATTSSGSSFFQFGAGTYGVAGNEIITTQKQFPNAIALRAGSGIGPRKFFSAEGFMAAKVHKKNSSYWTGQWGNGGKGLKNRYVGLKFQINNKFHYGWARVTVTTGNNRISALLTGYAYETIPNKPIIAGKAKGPNMITPQPASLGHLARGASAIPAWRVKQTTMITH